MSQQDMDRLREAIEARLSWTPYPEVERHRSEVVEAAVQVAAELLWLHAEAVWRSEDLDARRARWAEEHEKRRDELEAVEASRRDWAAIAMAHDMAAEFQAVGTLDDPWPEPPAVGAPCSCLTAEQAAVVSAGGFSLPLCAVHPEADR